MKFPPPVDEAEESSELDETKEYCIDEYGEEIPLDRAAKRTFTPAMRARIAGGKIVTRKKLTREERRRQALL